MSFFKDQAIKKLSTQKNKKTILFVEGWNVEIKKAACLLEKENVITPILLLRDSSELDDSIKNIKHLIINELSQTQVDDFASYMYELRKHKGLELDEAKKLCIQPHYLSALMLKRDEVDGVVCGIEYTTKDTLRAALQIIKQAKDASIVTSAMMMERNDEIMVLGDCSLVLDPDTNQLVSIAKELSLFCHNTLNFNRIDTALLSYSTAGSGAGASVDKVVNAFKILEQDQVLKGINANIFGEIQFDACYVDAIRTKKAPNCSFNQRPNIFVFPNLDAGNIGYKILERCANFLAIGPVILGLDKPMNDLSRGASAESVLEIAYITACQVK